MKMIARLFRVAVRRQVFDCGAFEKLVCGLKWNNMSWLSLNSFKREVCQSAKPDQTTNNHCATVV